MVETVKDLLMKMSIAGLTFCMVLMGACLHAATFCLDGGGSKTLLNSLDEHGNFMPLEDAGREGVVLRVEGGVATRMAPGSNFNKIGRDGFKKVLQDIFAGVHITPGDRVIAGMAGLGLPANRAIATEVFVELGFNPDHLTVLSDADIGLELIEGPGAILISGTGSVCFAKKDGTRFQVGGLGTVMGDEGSGYRIGLEALKRVFQQDLGYERETALTATVRASFGLTPETSVRSLNGPIMRGEITPARIAALAPMVFDVAYAGDVVAMSVIDGAAKDLGGLLAAMIDLVHLDRCPLHLWGGTFKNRYADDFIVKMLASDERLTAVYAVTNRANENPAVLLARQRLAKAGAA